LVFQSTQFFDFDGTFTIGFRLILQPLFFINKGIFVFIHIVILQRDSFFRSFFKVLDYFSYLIINYYVSY